MNNHPPCPFDDQSRRDILKPFRLEDQGDVARLRDAVRRINEAFFGPRAIGRGLTVMSLPTDGHNMVEVLEDGERIGVVSFPHGHPRTASEPGFWAVDLQKSKVLGAVLECRKLVVREFAERARCETPTP